MFAVFLTTDRKPGFTAAYVFKDLEEMLLESGSGWDVGSWVVKA